MNYLVDVSEFLYFFLLREGEGGVRGAGRGFGFLLTIPGGGGVLQEGEGPRGREGGCLRRIGDFGGRARQFFFSGAEMSTKIMLWHRYIYRF